MTDTSLLSNSDAERMKTLRRDIHAHPELAFEEKRTSDLVARTLEAAGIEVHRGLAKTGVRFRRPGFSSERSVARHRSTNTDLDGGQRHVRRRLRGGDRRQQDGSLGVGRGIRS